MKLENGGHETSLISLRKLRTVRNKVETEQVMEELLRQ